jgi:hypothetical protein
LERILERSVRYVSESKKVHTKVIKGHDSYGQEIESEVPVDERSRIAMVGAKRSSTSPAK